MSFCIGRNATIVNGFIGLRCVGEFY